MTGSGDRIVLVELVALASTPLTGGHELNLLGSSKPAAYCSKSSATKALRQRVWWCQTSQMVRPKQFGLRTNHTPD